MSSNLVFGRRQEEIPAVVPLLPLKNLGILDLRAGTAVRAGDGAVPPAGADCGSGELDADRSGTRGGVVAGVLEPWDIGDLFSTLLV